jgi:DHA2 family methylenomycin A resistance protein-like MFS transporter
MAGFAIFTLASLGCALAPTLAVLIAARAVQGLGAAVLVPSSLALLNHAYPGEQERGQAVSIWAAGASLALTAGPLVGDGLIAAAGWRSIFLVNVPIGLVGLWLTWRNARETPKSLHGRIDLPGQVTAIVAPGCLSGAIIKGGALGWSNGLVVTGFIGFLIAAAAFVIIERRAEQPMLPLPMFENRAFSTIALVGFLVNTAFYGLIFVFSLYFQQVNGLSAFWTGLAFVPMMAAVFFPNLIAARVARQIGAKSTIALGAGLAAASALALLEIDQGTRYDSIVLQLMVMAAGLGLLVPPLTSTLLGSVDKSRSGVASGVLNSMRQTGSVLGVALFGSLGGSADGVLPGLRPALIIAATLLASGAAAVLIGIPGRKFSGP